MRRYIIIRNTLHFFLPYYRFVPKRTKTKQPKSCKQTKLPLLQSSQHKNKFSWWWQ